MPHVDSASAASASLTTALITSAFNGSPIVFHADGWFYMTKAAQHFCKELQRFIRMDDTPEDVAAL